MRTNLTALAMLLLTCCSGSPSDTFEKVAAVTQFHDRGPQLSTEIDGPCTRPRIYKGPRTQINLGDRPLFGMTTAGMVYTPSNPLVFKPHDLSTLIEAEMTRTVPGLRVIGGQYRASDTIRQSSSYLQPRGSKGRYGAIGRTRIATAVMKVLGPPRYAYSTNGRRCHAAMTMIYGDPPRPKFASSSSGSVPRECTAHPNTLAIFINDDSYDIGPGRTC